MSKLPKGWISNRIDEFSDVNIRPKKGELSDTLEVSFIPMKTVEAEIDKIRLIETKLVEQVKKGYTPIKENDVIFAKVTPCMENGKIAVANGLQNGYAFGSSEFHTLRAKNGNVSKFLQLYLIQHSFRQDAAQNMTGAVGLRRVPKAYLSEQKIPTPPIPEQKRIVKKLDDCQQQIDSSSEALAKLPQLLADYRASLLASAFRGDLTAKWRAEQKAQGIQHESAQDFLKRLRQERQQQWQKTELQKYKGKGKTPPKDWEAKYEEPASLVLKTSKTGWLTLKIEHICSIIDGDRGKSYPKKHDFSAQGYCLFLNTKNVTSQGLSFIKNQFITKQKDDELRKGRVEKGDLVITTRGTIGNVGYFHKNTPFNIIRINSGMVILRPHSEVFNGHFLKYLLRSPIATKQIDNLSSGSAQPQIPIRDFKKCDFPIPPIAEQTEIVRILEIAFAKIDAIETLHIKLTTEHTQLTQSLLAKAFHGELVPQNPDDEPASILLKCIQEQRSQDEAAPKIKKKQSKRTKSTNKKTMNKSRFDEEVHEKPYLRDLLKTNSDLDTAEKLFNQSQLNLIDFYKQLDWETKTDFIESKNSKLQITS